MYLCNEILQKQQQLMMIYISCAKTMTARSRQQVPYTTVPYFEKEEYLSW